MRQVTTKRWYFDTYGFEARLRAGPPTDTVATALSTLPHGLLIRTQNCVGPVMAGVKTDGALPPSGWVKSKLGPWYH